MKNSTKKLTNEEFKKMFQEKLKNRKKTKVKPKPPRYDDVFFEGLEYLNELANR